MHKFFRFFLFFRSTNFTWNKPIPPTETAGEGQRKDGYNGCNWGIFVSFKQKGKKLKNNRQIWTVLRSFEILLEYFKLVIEMFNQFNMGQEMVKFSCLLIRILFHQVQVNFAPCYQFQTIVSIWKVWKYNRPIGKHHQ